MKNLDNLKGIHIAHRGLHNIENQVPENSMLAFKKALENNIPIEFDVHILKDGKIVVFHDDNLERMIGIKKELKDCTYDEIKNLKLLNTEEKIPLFEDVLQIVNGKVLIDIEFKFDVKTGKLEREACKYLDNYKGNFIVKSFNPFSVNWFRKNKPEYIRGQLTSDFKENNDISRLRKFIIKNMVLNFISKPDFIAYDINSITEKLANRIRKNKLLFLWTIRTKEQLKFSKKIADVYIYEKIDI